MGIIGDTAVARNACAHKSHNTPTLSSVRRACLCCAFGSTGYDTDHARGQGGVEDGAHAAANGVGDAGVLNALVQSVVGTRFLLVSVSGPARRHESQSQGSVVVGG